MGKKIILIEINLSKKVEITSPTVPKNIIKLKGTKNLEANENKKKRRIGKK